MEPTVPIQFFATQRTLMALSPKNMVREPDILHKMHTRILNYLKEGMEPDEMLTLKMDHLALLKTHLEMPNKTLQEFDV